MEARDLVLIVRFKEAGIIYCCYDLGFYTNLAIQVIKIINKMYYTLGGGTPFNRNFWVGMCH